MERDPTKHEAPTRRDYLKSGGALIGGGLLAGCSGDQATSTTGTETSTLTTSETTDAESTSETNTTGEESYTVTMSPMGAVEFETIPQNVLASSTSYLDITAALGHGSAARSTGHPSTTLPSLKYYYPKLGVSTDWMDDLKKAGNYSKETLYELDSDVHFLDPAYVSTLDGWSQSDIREITENVGPFFGNMYSRKDREPPESYRDSYQYYTIWELTEKYAEVFREEARFDALNALRKDLLNRVQSKLPPQDERPTAAMVYPRLKEDSFYVQTFNHEGYFYAHTRPLGATDAFADIQRGEYGGKLVDYEAMLDADPEVILLNHAISSYYDVPDTKKSIRTDSVGSELTAVKNDRLYASGNPRQGPIMNLFQLEMTAKQFYPDQFGEWPGFVAGEPYPDVPEDEQLFDRQRLAHIVNGDF